MFFSINTFHRECKHAHSYVYIEVNNCVSIINKSKINKSMFQPKTKRLIMTGSNMML